MSFHTEHEYASLCLETLIFQDFSMESIIPFQVLSLYLCNNCFFRSLFSTCYVFIAATTSHITFNFKEIAFGITSRIFQIVSLYYLLVVNYIFFIQNQCKERSKFASVKLNNVSISRFELVLMTYNSLTNQRGLLTIVSAIHGRTQSKL